MEKACKIETSSEKSKACRAARPEMSNVILRGRNGSRGTCERARVFAHRIVPG